MMMSWTGVSLSYLNRGYYKNTLKVLHSPTTVLYFIAVSNAAKCSPMEWPCKELCPVGPVGNLAGL